MSYSLDLSGRTALVTGSTRGIGRAIAGGLAKAGADVIVHGRSEAAAVAEAGEINAAGGRATGLAADLSDEPGVRALADALRLGGIEPDILVLNASSEILETLDRVDGDSVAHQMNVNIGATVRLLQAFLPAMCARGWGRIIAIGSVQEYRPNAEHLVYAASKAAQTNMILNLARTTRNPGVTFNVIQPGAILTDRNRARLDETGFRVAVEAAIPLGRIGTAEDCVGAAVLLASDAAAYVNGATIPIDGGRRL